MSGIFGKVGSTAQSETGLARMSQLLAHRGPDDSGLHMGRGVALGCRLLRTGDSDDVRQPVSNADGTVFATIDGAIYNRAELREQLERQGRHLHGNADAQLLLHLYEAMGTDFVCQLRGHFAFAIWDAARKRLLLARDHLGQKPLFYAELSDGFYFASEVKALLAVMPVSPELDLASLDRYLSLRFVPGSGSMVRGVRKLPSAHWLVYDRGRISTSRHWQLSFAKKLNLSHNEYIDGLQSKFEETVAVQMTPAGTSGAFLSGGLDSSLIVAMMARNSNRPIPTFSIGFAEKEFDETPYARLVSERFGTRHHDALAGASLIRSMPTIIRGLDEPSDPVAGSFFAASQLASKHVKVAFGGDGGNELFAGCDRYRGVLMSRYYSLIPAAIRQAILVPLLGLMPASLGYDSLSMKLRWFEQMARTDDTAQRLADAISFFRFNRLEKDQLLTARARREIEPGEATRAIRQCFEESDADHPIERMVYTDYCTRLPDHLLMLVDRMGMVHGLDVRSPLVDKELVEYMAALPVHMKVRGRQPRYIWYRLADRLLPASIARRKKRGFRFPLAHWFALQLQPFLRRVLEDSTLAADGIFETSYMLRILDEHRDRRFDHHWKIWMLLNLETWYRMTIKGHRLSDTEQWIEQHHRRSEAVHLLPPGR